MLPNIKISAPNMTPTMQRIAAFVLDHPEETTQMSVEELSTHIKVSIASVYRFCREMNYQTFSHLKLAIARELSTQVRDGSPDSDGEPAHTLFDEYAEKVRETGSFLNAKTLASVTDLILRSDRIMVVGLGASGIGASFLHYKFSRAGIVCHRPMDMHLATMLASSFGPKDLLIVFSASGATRDIVDICGLATKSKTPIVGITSRRKNPVEKYSTFHLVAVASDSPVTSGSGASVISQIALADSIYIDIYNRNESIRKHVELTTDTIISKHL
ncbi:MurR/RpiR family transcriptional regulator [Notoacmeibacter ruber]|uniref:MurR/RpiR family transcriptional regulator n=1 Tax=Notoacmeibacter ruber TaxID=2670375 RepID=UPI0013149A45|nr:MurR/RpiR family transcriptional regulator [Notoacmeibacter ruber]